MAMPVEAIRAGAGLVDLFRPSAVGALELGRAAERPERVVYRLLGARQIVQAVVVDRTGWTALGAGVDLLHGASMLALAALSPRHRRGALVQATVAACFAAAELSGRRA